MSTKRYGISLPEEVYRYFRMQAVQEGISVGQWLTREIHMEEPIKKAIEPDKAKPSKNNPDKLSKGLGPLPGETPSTWEDLDSYRRFTPAPKPKK